MKTEHAIDWRKSAEEISDDYEAKCKEIDRISAAHHELNIRCDEYMLDNKRMAAEIDNLKSGMRESIAHITKLQLLCDQVGAALEAMAGYGNLFRTSSNQRSPYHLAVEALTAWRSSK